MRKAIVLGVAFLMLAAMTTFAEEAKHPTPPCNVILIGWDGAQRNHVKECLACDDLPNLRRLINEGTIVAIDVLRTTDTKNL